MVGLNELLVNKFVEVFGKDDYDDDPTNDFTIPIVPTFGNNDILPHNIFTDGPNRWTKRYLRIWRKFIPEEQRHVFARGGWFFVEVIPGKLAVFSINTLYFFDSNTAVDGCADASEPGYEQMEWLRIQLQLMRSRGMKAILMGHVPPARTENKLSWDETCWQKYTMWVHQYRDVVVGSAYGHMNIDHFMLQDSADVNQKAMDGEAGATLHTALDDEFTIQSSAEYLSDLRTGWRRLPDTKGLHVDRYTGDVQGKSLAPLRTKKKKPKKSKKSRKEKYFEKIGGEWGERYSLSLVSPSVVPKYYPTMRVIEYNISGLDYITEGNSINHNPSAGSETQIPLGTEVNNEVYGPVDEPSQTDNSNYQTGIRSKKTKKTPKEERKHKSKKPKFTMPLPPSRSSPPGPAYSPQTFTWLRLTQYVANITTINDDFTTSSSKLRNDEDASSSLSQPADFALEASFDEQRWHEGKHSGEKPKHKKGHKAFKYEIEYDTRTDPVLNLTDLTVRSYIELASRMGHYKPSKSFSPESCDGVNTGNSLQKAKIQSYNAQQSANRADPSASSKKRGKSDKNKQRRRRRKENEKLWFTFVRRAFVGSWDEEELRDEFGNG